MTGMATYVKSIHLMDSEQSISQYTCRSILENIQYEECIWCIM